MARQLSVPQWFCWCLANWLNHPKTSGWLEGSRVCYDANPPFIRIHLEGEVVGIDRVSYSSLLLVFTESEVTIYAGELYSENHRCIGFDLARKMPRDVATWLKKHTPLEGRWSNPTTLPEGYDAHPWSAQ